MPKGKLKTSDFILVVTNQQSPILDHSPELYSVKVEVRMGLMKKMIEAYERNL